MRIELGFAKNGTSVEIDEKNLAGVLLPNEVEVGLTGPDEVRRALASPIGKKPLRDYDLAGKKIAVVTSDISRPMPSYKVLPALLDELNAAGAADENITVVFALGSHRGHTEEEKRHLVSDAVYDRVRCIDANAEHCVHLGTTSRGTPVDIFDVVANADFRICLGNIEFHYFAGYSGGMKAIMPGVSTRAAIRQNHSHMVEDGSYAGHLEGNPVREDIEEVARFCPVDYIVNVVLDAHKEIIKAVAGDVVAAHREGCRFLDRLYKVTIPRRADIVIVSAGGFPKDMNMYQAQKALDNAKHAVRDGGVIIWVASCSEGLGEKHFEEWMTGHEKSEDMIPHIRRDFILGGHKAAAIALVLQRAKVMLVSDLTDVFARSVFMDPKPSVQAALSDALRQLGADASVIVMPWGGSTLPHAVGLPMEG